jgi:hypothetical protein
MSIAALMERVGSRCVVYHTTEDASGPLADVTRTLSAQGVEPCFVDYQPGMLIDPGHGEQESVRRRIFLLPDTAATERSVLLLVAGPELGKAYRVLSDLMPAGHHVEAQAERYHGVMPVWPPLPPAPPPEPDEPDV